VCVIADGGARMVVGDASCVDGAVDGGAASIQPRREGAGGREERLWRVCACVCVCVLTM
jgi:hypothetical protein